MILLSNEHCKHCTGVPFSGYCIDLYFVCRLFSVTLYTFPDVIVELYYPEILN